ncbi:MAG: hypothetical protein BSR46_00285 [Candidatus Dactylopiibacterium carminicum]|uniref:FHA domain-containing protein n=1 Tax=Candidatus Dactylopiibacterium carminicum TaxID=857335 RepID=UPI000BCE96F3|nr:FHA domain-containing protein [Candidatus Dactylopiibacterium carminicum]PAT00832.1 MAG: hypothetical protein BSR46_00285 [Candidatus Dactylopiibacterium carminicum]
MTDTYILVAEVSGDQPLHGKLGSVETQRAVERCRNRAERAIEAYLGKHIKAEGRQLIAHFPRGENAALAAFDMRDRVRQLPPVSGVALAINIAVHARTTEDPADDVAQSLARVCPSGQILVSEEAAEGFPPNIREQLGTADLDAPPDLYPQPLYVFRTGATLAGTMAKAGEPATAPAASTSPAPAARSDAETVARPVGMRGSLMLRHNKNNLSVSDRQPVVLAGREEGNDLVIADRRASRHHARIEWRQNHFILIDTSTNGTYMVDDEGHEVVLRRGETDLPKRGRIGFGYSPTEVGAEVVFFDLGHR